MRRADFDYELPSELIAQRPPAERAGARLLQVGTEGLANRQVRDLPSLLNPGDLMVFNDTRVLPARLFGQKSTGGKVEILVERLLDARRFRAQLGVSKTPRADGMIECGERQLRVIGRDNDLFELELLGEEETLPAFLERVGRLPLPPYIRHTPDAEDAQRYQTVFAASPGAVAAPTAGLHFDESLLAALDARGVQRAVLTLHVGAGTFQPVRVDDLSEHRMHSEHYVVPAALRHAVADTWARGGRVVAAGTTVARALESSADAEGLPTVGEGDTRLFITPGYRFKTVQRLFTNFHLPQSTLLMMVCAFGGHERLLGAYRQAVAERYRFFSYGDAMLIDPSPGAPGA